MCLRYCIKVGQTAADSVSKANLRLINFSILSPRSRQKYDARIFYSPAPLFKSILQFGEPPGWLHWKFFITAISKTKTTFKVKFGVKIFDYPRLIIVLFHLRRTSFGIIAILKLNAILNYGNYLWFFFDLSLVRFSNYLIENAINSEINGKINCSSC